MLYAWENPALPVDEVINDILRCFHHPSIRDDRVEIQRNMYATVKSWADSNLNRSRAELLSLNSVKEGRNLTLTVTRRREGRVDFWKDFWKKRRDRNGDHETLNRLWWHVEKRYNVRHNIYIRDWNCQPDGCLAEKLVCGLTNTTPSQPNRIAAGPRAVPIVDAPERQPARFETTGRGKPASQHSEKTKAELDEEIPTLFSKMETEKKAIVTEQDEE